MAIGGGWQIHGGSANANLTAQIVRNRQDPNDRSVWLVTVHNHQQEGVVTISAQTHCLTVLP